MNALYILSEGSIQVLVDLAAIGNTCEIARRFVPKGAMKGDRFLLFDHDSQVFAACGEIASDAVRDPNEDSKYYFSALRVHGIFEDDYVISRAQVIEAHPAWVADFPEWKWIQHSAKGRRPGYSFNARVPNAVGEELWKFVLDVGSVASDGDRSATALPTDEHPNDTFEQFYSDVAKSLQDSQSSRHARLAKASKTPERTTTTSTSFKRNPDVVAEVLLRANGKCESCLQPAPFRRASDGTPYLEVHHRVMLASGGDDTVANAMALCPNCHRAAHYAQPIIPLGLARKAAQGR